MPLFQYRALQADGGIAEGQLEAAGRQEVFRQIESRGLRLVSLNEKAGAPSASAGSLPASLGSFKFKFGSQKISARALENFTRLLSSLLAAGVQIGRAHV